MELKYLNLADQRIRIRDLLYCFRKYKPVIGDITRRLLIDISCSIRQEFIWR